jgi:hypothetical protein
MTRSITVAPPHSLVLVMDSGGGELPASIEGIVTSTDSCIAVGCTCEIDGPTEISLGTLDEMAAGLTIAFDGFLSTPQRSVTVQTVYGEILTDAAVPTTRTAVRIGVNDEREPDRVFIAVG